MGRPKKSPAPDTTAADDSTLTVEESLLVNTLLSALGKLLNAKPGAHSEGDQQTLDSLDAAVTPDEPAADEFNLGGDEDDTPKPPTEDDVRAQLRVVMKSTDGKKKVAAIFKKLGVDDFAKVKTTEYASVIAMCAKVLK